MAGKSPLKLTGACRVRGTRLAGSGASLDSLTHLADAPGSVSERHSPIWAMLELIGLPRARVVASEDGLQLGKAVSEILLHFN